MRKIPERSGAGEKEKMSFMEELKKSIDQEARESGRLDPDQITAGNTSNTGSGPAETPTRVDKESIIDTPINFQNLTSENIEEYIKTCPVNDKGYPIVSDAVFDEYFQILPKGTVNQSGTWRASCNGKLKILGGDPERDREIQSKGGEAMQATLKQRRTMAEDLLIMLSQKASPEIIAALNLKADATNQEAVTAAAILQATDGNIKAGQFIRDTIGEQPTAKQDLNVSMTDDDKRLLEKVEARLNS